MKILHVITSLRTGGAEKLMVDLLPRLRDKGHDVDLLLFDGSDTTFRKEIESIGIKVYDFGVGHSVYHPKNLFKLIPFLKKYDIVHTHNYAPQIFTAIGSLFSKTKLVTTEHNTSNRRRKWKWYAMIDRWMYSRYNRIICISDKTEKNLRDFIGVCKSDISTINNGIDTQKYITARASHILEGIAPGSRKIIMVAAFRWEKDQDTIIKTLKHLPDKFHLFFVGDGVRRNICQQLSESENVSNRVHFMGIRTDVPSLLREADYVVVSSHIEGFGLVAVEGMASGTPVIASDVDGLREVVSGGGITFEYSDSNDLAKKIKVLEESPRKYESITKSCVKRALEFDISIMVDNYAKVYSTLRLLRSPI